MLNNNIPSPDYWKNLNPDLTISDFPFKSCTAIDIPDSIVNQSTSKVKEEGYFQTPALIAETHTTQLAAAVQNVVSAGLPAVFAFAYDEFWGLAAEIKGMIEPILGETPLLSPGDMWIWCVDENGHTSGWGAHRDLHDINVLHTDGRTKILTAWIPLTDATPLNGCMYLVPKHTDPNFPGNLEDRSIAIDTMQNIRALPAKAGSILGWSPLLLHWGGRHSGHAVGPRISIAYYLNNGEQEYGCGIPIAADTYVPFWYRLGVIAAMIKLFDGSPLAADLKFPDSLKSTLQPYLDKIVASCPA